MKIIALEFTYHTDMIEVPDNVADKIRKIQMKFDKWLYDKSIDHDCWVIVNGQKKGVSFDSSDFVNYINSYIITDGDFKARVVQKNLQKTPNDIPVLFF